MSPTGAETCSKCGRLLPPSQQACVFGGMIVCAECDKVLRSKQTPQQAVSTEMDKIQFQCSGCGKSVSVPVEKAGKTDKCPFCGVAVQISQTPDYYKADLMAACAALGKAWELQESGEVQRAKNGLELAEKWVREVLQVPCLPPAVETDALCVLGMRYKSDGIAQFAKAQATLEKGLALGRSKGFVLDQEWLYADVLGDVYDHAVHTLIISGELDEAKALLSRVDGFVSHYKQCGKFDRVRHEGYILFARGMIAGHEGQLDNSIHLLKQLLASPFKEYFASNKTHNFVLERACHNIGRVYFLKFYRVKEAIPYLEEALRYGEEGDDDYQTTASLLEAAKSQAASASELPAVPSDLKEKLDSLRSGDDETRLTVLEQLPTDLPHEYFRAVQSAVMQAMGAGDSRVRLRGAMLLVSIGDDSYPPVDVLLGNLSPPPSKDESKVKRFALYGLSYVKGREDVVGKLVEVAEQDQDAMVRERAVFALAATGNAAARQFVDGLANTGNEAALFALEWATKDVNSLRDAILNDREGVPGGALATIAHGWNKLPWGVTLEEFQRKFPEAYIDGPCWLTGEGEERFERIRMPVTKYEFNKKGQLFLVAFYPADGVNLLGDDYASHLMGIFGNPNGAIGTSWSYDTIVLKATPNCLVLLNTAFDDDPLSWEHWTGKKMGTRDSGHVPTTATQKHPSWLRNFFGIIVPNKSSLNNRKG